MPSKKSAESAAPEVLGAVAADVVETAVSTGPAEPAAAPTVARAKRVFARLKSDHRWNSAQIGSLEFTKEWRQLDANSPFYGEWIASELLEFGDSPE